MDETTLTRRVHATRVVCHVADSWSAFDGTPEAQRDAHDAASTKLRKIVLDLRRGGGLK
jgi:hypothetical protein